MHRGWRRQRDFRGYLGDILQEDKLIHCDGTNALELARRIGRRERHLVTAIVAKAERRVPHLQPVGAFDEPCPIRATAEFPVGYDLQSDLLLHPHGIADALILDASEFIRADLAGGMLAEC